jgi:hypothetical protein
MNSRNETINDLETTAAAIIMFVFPYERIKPRGWDL